MTTRITAEDPTTGETTTITSTLPLTQVRADLVDDWDDTGNPFYVRRRGPAVVFEEFADGWDKPPTRRVTIREARQ